MAGRYWLFKSEPGAYSYDDLVKDGIGEWDGVRNFQARNLLRDEIKIGDRVLFYHSNTNPPAVMGTAIVTRNGYPDHTAWDPESAHPDPRSTPANPIWYMVDIKADERLANPVTLQSIRDNTKISNMVLVRRGMRLSVQPVTQLEFETIFAMGKEH